MRAQRNRGFSVVELMVAMAIFAMLIVLAVPAYREFVANSQIRNAAESLLQGARLAQATAVRTNLPTIFAVDSNGWTVSTDDPDNTGTPLFTESYALSESAKNVSIAITPGNAKIVTYGGMGRVIANDDGSTTITSFDLTNPSYSDSRPLRVLISDTGTGGGTRMCDPAIASSDPQGCP